MRTTRRGFFGAIFRSVAMGAALLYTPSVLAPVFLKEPKLSRVEVLGHEWEELKRRNRSMKVTKDRYVELRLTDGTPHQSTYTNHKLYIWYPRAEDVEGFSRARGVKKP